MYSIKIESIPFPDKELFLELARVMMSSVSFMFYGRVSLQMLLERVIDTNLYSEVEVGLIRGTSILVRNHLVKISSSPEEDWIYLTKEGEDLIFNSFPLGPYSVYCNLDTDVFVGRVYEFMWDQLLDPNIPEDKDVLYRFLQRIEDWNIELPVVQYLKRKSSRMDFRLICYLLLYTSRTNDGMSIETVLSWLYDDRESSFNLKNLQNGKHPLQQLGLVAISRNTLILEERLQHKLSPETLRIL